MLLCRLAASGCRSFCTSCNFRLRWGMGNKKKDWKINGNQKEEGWEKTMGKKKKEEESDGKEKCEWKWKR